MHANQPSITQLEQAAASGNEMAALQLGNRLLSENPPGSAQCEKGLELLRSSASSGDQAPAAQWLLGAFYLHNLSFPGSLPQAVKWIDQASKSRVGLAVDRMANLCLRGVGLDYQPERALELLRQLADAGFQQSAWEVGYLTSTLDDVVNARESATAFARACALGHPLAYYSLGLRFGYGAGVEQDLAFARALLLSAANAGIQDAHHAADELAPSDHYGEQASIWLTRLNENHTATGSLRQRLSETGFIIPADRHASVDQLETHFANIGHPSLIISDDGRLEVKSSNSDALRAQPSDWHWVSQTPRVATSSQFISREERTHILRMVGGAMMNPEQYAGQGVRGGAETKFFNGRGMAFGTLDSDTVVRCIERRVSAFTDWDMKEIDPSSVISYKPNQEYRPHVDYFEEHEISAMRDQINDYAGQRIVTFLICLQAADSGGETSYPDANVTVTHATGSAMMHYNVLPDGSPDPLSLHHGYPIKAGEKWLLRTTLREHTRYRNTDN